LLWLFAQRMTSVASATYEERTGQALRRRSLSRRSRLAQISRQHVVDALRYGVRRQSPSSDGRRRRFGSQRPKACEPPRTFDPKRCSRTCGTLPRHSKGSHDTESDESQGRQISKQGTAHVGQGVLRTSRSPQHPLGARATMASQSYSQLTSMFVTCVRFSPPVRRSPAQYERMRRSSTKSADV